MVGTQMVGTISRRSFLYAGTALAIGTRAAARMLPAVAVESTQTLQCGAARLQIDFAHGDFLCGRAAIVARIADAAAAVATYYGAFPVNRVRVIVTPAPGRSGVLQGTTWGAVDGFQALLRLRIGEGTTAPALREDWIITHELVHTALANLPDDQHWLEEGIASYVEPIARVQAGQIHAETIWAQMVEGMTNGEPATGDKGLDHTHSWGRNYWGGALFCLVADVALLRASNNRRGLQTGLRAIVNAGGTLDKDWPLPKLLAVADQATETRVLSEMYATWSDAPITVDLPALWKQLGVSATSGTVTLDDAAPLAATRKAITARPPR